MVITSTHIYIDGMIICIRQYRLLKASSTTMSVMPETSTVEAINLLYRP